jgi:vacuolar-type H+-ATPase subunit C/Vma6
MALYDYGNTRLRARISRLQTIETLEAFSDLTSIDSLISALTKTPYQESIETALTYAHGYSCVAEAMRSELHRIVTDLNRFFDGNARENINGIFKRNDLLNIKAILRGLAHEVRLDDITNSFSPLGTIPDPVLVQIAKSKDVLEAISRIVVFQLPVAKPLMELKASHHDLNSFQIELALEKWYFSRIPIDYDGRSEESHTLKQYYFIEADIVNLNNILRFVNSSAAYDKLGANFQDLFVTTGDISAKKLMALSKMESVEDVIHALLGTRYGGYLQRALTQYKNTHRLSEFENQMRSYLLNWMVTLPKQCPLGIGVPLGYATMKESEIRNIRWIAKGIQSSFDPAYIKENLERIR